MFSNVKVKNVQYVEYESQNNESSNFISPNYIDENKFSECLPGKKEKLILDLSGFESDDFLKNYNSIETTYFTKDIKITNSFNPKTLEKVMFKISFPVQDSNGNILAEPKSLDDECSLMILINKIKKSDEFFVQVKGYQKMLTYSEKSRMILGVEAGICSMGDAIKFRRKLKFPYSEEEIVYISCHLLEALSLLKENMIFHSDIKPENIFLFNKNGKWIYKIGDFGLSIKTTSKIIDTEDIQTIGGTKGFMIPEISSFIENKTIFHSKIDIFEADLYSLGKTLEELINGTYPKTYEKVSSIINEMTRQNKNERKTVEFFLNEFKNLKINPTEPDESKIENMTKKKLLKSLL